MKLFVQFEVLTAVVMKSSIFWDITPCNPLKVTRCSSETSVDSQRITWHYIPEDRIFQLNYLFIILLTVVIKNIILKQQFFERIIP
jgi:hypothetical protein